MPQEFDIYMVSVEWESENQIRKFTPSIRPLELSEFKGNTYLFDNRLSFYKNCLFFQH